MVAVWDDCELADAELAARGADLLHVEEGPAAVLELRDDLGPDVHVPVLAREELPDLGQASGLLCRRLAQLEGVFPRGAALEGLDDGLAARIEHLVGAADRRLGDPAGGAPHDRVGVPAPPDGLRDPVPARGRSRPEGQVGSGVRLMIPRSVHPAHSLHLTVC